MPELAHLAIFTIAALPVILLALMVRASLR